MAPLPTPEQVGLTEPPQNWAFLLRARCDTLEGRGYMGSYSRETGRIQEIARPVTVYDNHTAQEIGAANLNEHITRDIFCGHALVLTNDLEKCRSSIRLKQTLFGGTVRDYLMPAHKCAYAIVIRGIRRFSASDLFLEGRLVVPVVNWTHPLVIFRHENPYLAILHVPRAGAIYTGRRAPPPLTDNRPAVETPPPPPKRARRTSPRHDDDDDEVSIIYAGPRRSHSAKDGSKEDPIDVDTPIPSSDSKSKKRTFSDATEPSPSNDSQRLATQWSEALEISILPEGPFRGTRQLLSLAQVTRGKVVDNTLIVELKERYKANYYFGDGETKHPGHPTSSSLLLEPYRRVSALQIRAYTSNTVAMRAIRRLTSLRGLDRPGVQGLHASNVQCPACRRMFEGDAFWKHLQPLRFSTTTTFTCPQGGHPISVEIPKGFSKAQEKITSASLVAQMDATLDAEFPDDALTVAWTMWASDIGVPQDVFYAMFTGYRPCKECKMAHTFVAHTAHLQCCTSTG